MSQTSVGTRAAQCNWTVSGEFLPESALLNEIDVSRHAGVERGHERAGFAVQDAYLLISALIAIGGRIVIDRPRFARSQRRAMAFLRAPA